MKKGWRKLESIWERLGWGKMLVINLALCAFLMVLIWSRFGYPLPTAEMEFRRMERTHLLPRSEIVFNSGKDGPLRWRDLPELDFGRDDIVIGARDGYACVYKPEYNIVKTYHLAEGTTPVPMYHVTARWMPSPGTIRAGIPLMFLQTPEEAEQAMVEINAKDSGGKDLRYRGEGWRLAPGQWIFAAAPGDSFSGDWYAGGSYTLTLCRADGSLLLEKNGTLEEY